MWIRPSIISTQPVGWCRFCVNNNKILSNSKWLYLSHAHRWLLTDNLTFIQNISGLSCGPERCTHLSNWWHGLTSQNRVSGVRSLALLPAKHPGRLWLSNTTELAIAVQDTAEKAKPTITLPWNSAGSHKGEGLKKMTCNYNISQTLMFSSAQRLYICLKWKLLLQVNWSFLCVCTQIYQQDWLLSFTPSHHSSVKRALHVFHCKK